MKLRHRIALLTAAALLLTAGEGVASAAVDPGTRSDSLGEQISQAVNQGLQQAAVDQVSTVVNTAINTADASTAGCFAGCPAVATANNLISSLSLDVGTVVQVMSQQAVNASPTINVAAPTVTVSPTITVTTPTITIRIGGG